MVEPVVERLAASAVVGLQFEVAAQVEIFAQHTSGSDNSNIYRIVECRWRFLRNRDILQTRAFLPQVPHTFGNYNSNIVGIVVCS